MPNGLQRSLAQALKRDCLICLINFSHLTMSSQVLFRKMTIQPNLQALYCRHLTNCGRNDTIWYTKETKCVYNQQGRKESALIPYLVAPGRFLPLARNVQRAMWMQHVHTQVCVITHRPNPILHQNVNWKLSGKHAISDNRVRMDKLTLSHSHVRPHSHTYKLTSNICCFETSEN